MVSAPPDISNIIRKSLTCEAPPGLWIRNCVYGICHTKLAHSRCPSSRITRVLNLSLQPTLLFRVGNKGSCAFRRILIDTGENPGLKKKKNHCVFSTGQWALSPLSFLLRLCSWVVKSTPSAKAFPLLKSQLCHLLARPAVCPLHGIVDGGTVTVPTKES